MAVKSLVVGGLASSQLGSLNFRTRHPAFALSWENQQKRAAPKWVFLGGVSGLSIGRAKRLLEDENPWKPAKIMVQLVDYGQMGDDVSHGLHKDLSSLPKPLSISDIVAASEDGAKVRISYKGIPGSYSEDAALKAYPNCETVPCNDFEAAFKAVELWLADKVILPIENTSGGSIWGKYPSEL